MKRLLLLALQLFIFFYLNSVHAQNVVITEAPGNLPLNNQVFYFNYPYLYHGGSGTSINKFNINDFSDITSNSTTYTYASFGLGSTKIGGFEYILQGSTFYKINLATGARTNLQSYPCIFTNERATIVNDATNYIYVFGGRLGGTTLSNQLWRYDIGNNLWFQLSTAPYGMCFNSGAFIYPYIYTGGGGNNGSGVTNNGILRFNVLDNSWASINTPPLGPISTGSGTTVCAYEVYFNHNDDFYCLIPGENSYWPLSIYKYNSVLDYWTQQSSIFFPGGIANIGSVSNSPLTRIISIGNGNFIFSKNGVLNSMNGNLNCYTLSLSNKQTHVKINSTDCLDTLTSTSINLNYVVQLSGTYSNCNLNVKAVNGANSLIIRSLANISSNGQQILNFTDVIPISYKNGYIEIEIIENGNTTTSINKYPINKNISYSINGFISSTNSLSICTGTPIGTVLSVTNTPNNTYQWYFNGNVINGATNTSYTALQLGQYSCQITASNSCQTQPVVNYQQFSTPPTPSISASGPSSFCSGGSVILTSSSATGNTWSNGATSQSIIVSNSGNYTVSVSNGTCSSSLSTTAITVNPVPTTPTITASGPTTLCSGGSVILTSSSTTGNTWSNGATSQSIIVSNSGNYSVSVSNGMCSSLSSTTSVTVNPVPTIPTITASGPTTFCSGGSVTLTSSSTTGNTWSTGATSQSIIVSNSGNYSVSVSNGTCSSTSSQTIVNNNPPTPSITASGPTSFCYGGTVTLTSSSAAGNTWSNGATSQSITVSNSGNYSVSVSNGTCSSSSSTTSVTVNPVPITPIITSSGPTTFCSGGSVILTSSSATGNTWSNGATSQSIIVSNSGNYSVSVSNGTCSSSSSTNAITVNAVPTIPTITSSGPTTFCSGGSVTLTSSNATGNTWSNGSTSQFITVSNSGNYTVNVSNGVCSSSSSPTNITVNQLPTTPIITAIGNTTFCTGDSVLLASSYFNGNSWSNNLTAQSIYVIQSGLFSVQFTDNNGCVSISAPIVINVLPLPQVTIVSSGSTTICQGETVSITSSPSNSYFWSNGMTSQSIIVNQSGSYSVSVIASNGCSNSSSTISIIVNDNTSSILTETALDSYTLNGQTYTQNGTYYQVLQNSFGCDSTITLNLSLSYTGIDELYEGIKIYPNPTLDYLTIQYEIGPNTSFKLIDAIGKKMIEGSFIEGMNTIDLIQFSKGTYSLIIYGLDRPIKIIKN
ncbi:MAG: hypothetical protein RLZZ531_1421 [Bacteroidota bacterium]|jgi:hypothetical protein